MAEHEAAMDHNWLQSYLIESIDKRLCTNIDCTTCGAQPFRHGLLDAVPRATDQPRPPRLDRKTAYAIAQALARVEPVQSRTGNKVIDANCDYRYKEAVQLVIFDLWRILGRGVLARIEYESPERVAKRREEKRRQRREAHEQRLALKKERDRLWRLAHRETPPPKNIVLLPKRGSYMDTKKLVTGIVVGWITMFSVGYLISDMVMASFYKANHGVPFGIGRDSTLWLQVALGLASLATLVTLCIVWSGAKNATQGFKVGGMVGFLLWFGVDLIYLGYFTISTNIFPLVDASLEIVRTGIVGAAIATVLGRNEEA